MKNYKYICLIISLIFTLIILISPNFHILAPDNILIYHFINYFYFLPSLIINFLLVLFLVLFLHISYVTRARLSDSGVLISRKKCINDYIGIFVCISVYCNKNIH